MLANFHLRFADIFCRNAENTNEIFLENQTLINKLLIFAINKQSIAIISKYL